jgi:hypothetical protein
MYMGSLSLKNTPAEELRARLSVSLMIWVAVFMMTFMLLIYLVVISIRAQAIQYPGSVLYRLISFSGGT